jgi:hypothetical protein
MKKNIALLAGGYSGEYEISIKTAVTIANNLDANLYNVFKIIVTKESWLYTADDGHEIAIDKNDFSLTINSEKINFDAEEDCNALNILYFHRGELYSEDFVEIRSGLPLYSWCDDLHYALREPKIINNPELEYEWISKQGQKLIDLGETICGHNEFYNSSWYFKKVLTEYGIRYIETESNYRPYQDYISSGRWINDI